MRETIDLHIESRAPPHKSELYFVEMLFTDIEHKPKFAEIHWREEKFRKYFENLPFGVSQTRYKLTCQKTHVFRFFYKEEEEGLAGRLDGIFHHEGNFRDSSFRYAETLDLEIPYGHLRWRDLQRVEHMIGHVNNQIKIDVKSLPVKEREIYQRISKGLGIIDMK